MAEPSKCEPLRAEPVEAAEPGTLDPNGGAFRDLSDAMASRQLRSRCLRPGLCTSPLPRKMHPVLFCFNSTALRMEARTIAKLAAPE